MYFPLPALLYLFKWFAICLWLRMFQLYHLSKLSAIEIHNISAQPTATIIVITAWTDSGRTLETRGAEILMIWFQWLSGDY